MECTEAESYNGEKMGVGGVEEAKREIGRVLQSVFSPSAAFSPHQPPYLLTPNGMAAFVSLYSSVQQLSALATTSPKCYPRDNTGAVMEDGKSREWACPHHPTGRHRDTWLQVGCLYLDTAEVLAKFPAPACPVCDSLDPLPPTSSSSSSSSSTCLGRHRPNFSTLLRVEDSQDTGKIEALLRAWGGRLAGVVTETPSNPLLRTPNLSSISSLVKTWAPGAVLIVDPTMAGLGNLNPLPYADAVCVSLTKFLGCRGDVMGGGILVNPSTPHAPLLPATLGYPPPPPLSGDTAVSAASTSSPNNNLLGPLNQHYASSRELIFHWCSPYLMSPPLPLPSREARVLASAAASLPDTLATMNSNTRRVAEWLEARMKEDAAAGAGQEEAGESRLKLRAVHWALGGGTDSRSRDNFCALAAVSTPDPINHHLRHAVRGDTDVGCGCMITIELEGTWPEAGDSGWSHERSQSILGRFINALGCVKGPSFGTLFTLASPFIYLAHYNLVTCEEGRAELCALGINPYLVRISVGVEPIEDILKAIETALAA